MTLFLEPDQVEISFRTTITSKTISWNECGQYFINTVDYNRFTNACFLQSLGFTLLLENIQFFLGPVDGSIVAGNGK